MTPPCSTTHCANRALWLFASIRSRRLLRFCHECGPRRAQRGGYLVLVHSVPEEN